MSSTVLKFKKAVHAFIREMRADKYHLGDQYRCPVCRLGINHFKPMDYSLLEMADKYQLNYPMFSFETANYFQFACPKCNSNDRDRLYALYIEKNFSNVPAGKKYEMLDVAPSHLAKYLRALPFVNYRSADLYHPADDKVDLRDMNIYEDGRWDIFVCSHVLEHIKEDQQAMNELYRVLKPGGWGIAMVPINLSIEETFEDDSITTDADRWKYYGQDDHVRMYSKKDFVNKLKKAGFKVNEYGADYFGAESFRKHGIHPRSILYIVEKV
ncbi:MAG: methyltransferase domain-containing protein [Taibaiella sp.]|nr:methyltransferase domain-containing protein [Taibaiella sp.]